MVAELTPSGSILTWGNWLNSNLVLTIDSILKILPQGTTESGVGFFTELYGLALPVVVITSRETVGEHQGVYVEDVSEWANDGVVLGVSEEYDVACVWVQPVLPIETFEARVLRIGDSDGSRVHDTVYVLGFSDDQLPADTVVDAIGDTYITLRGNFRTADTGGHPVIDQYGEVVGMIRGGPANRVEDQAILINRIREEMPAMCGRAIP